MVGLALVAILLSLVLFGILCFVELPDHAIVQNIKGGMVIVSPGHPTNEQEFNELQNAGIKITEPEGGN